MEYLDLAYPTPQENLACDEALLELCEESYPGEILRFWEPKNYFVVLGYSNKIQTEVKIDSCTSDNIVILRRISGGGTVLQGPGCFNYSLVLRLQDRPELKTATSTNRHVMERHCQALKSLLNQEVTIEGDTDLAIDKRKFSGNAQRRKKHCLLFHGTFLLYMPLDKIESSLPLPSQQPFYRNARPHSDFVTNIHLHESILKESLCRIWNADSQFIATSGLAEKMKYLIRDKYSEQSWNEKF